MSGNDPIEGILSALRRVLPEREFVALHEPQFSGNEWAYVKECLDTGWVSSVGKFVDRFETMLQDITRAGRAVAVANGTAALHVCLQLAGVERDDEVLIPTLTFIATANAVSYCGAVQHFIDSEESTLGVDAAKLREYLRSIGETRDGKTFNRFTGRRIQACVPMHAFGHPVDLDPLLDVCAEFGIELIEDAAESLGSTYKGRHTGSIARLGALSFNGNKIVTTGGGGAVLTSDPELGRRAKHLTTQAKVPHRWEFVHDAVGYNYRLPNLNAALGCAQLEQLESFVEAKRSLAALYVREFDAIGGVEVFREPSFARSNYWLNVLVLRPEIANRREELLAATNDAGIMTRPVWKLMHSLSMFADRPRMDVSCAEDLERRLVNIPSSSSLAPPTADRSLLEAEIAR